MTLKYPPLSGILKNLYRSFAGGMELRSLFGSKPEYVRVQDFPLPLKRSYFVTTNTGVYRIADGALYRVFPFKSYGIAIGDDAVFLSSHIGRYSVVVRCDKAPFFGSGGSGTFLRCLYLKEDHDSSDRLHGLFLGREGLWVTNTGRNSLMLLNTTSGEIMREVPPFADSFGTPLFYNVNHFNSVSEYGGVQLFVANRGGERSLVGMLDGSRVTCFAYRFIGVHDIFLSTDNLFYCDTFGDPEKTPHAGSLMTTGGAVDPAYFGENPRLVRGMAGNPSDEMLVGGSFSGTRAERFKGRGTVLSLAGGKVSGEVKLMHSAQIYQIIRDDGTFIEGAPSDITSGMIRKRMEDVLGEPVFEGEVPCLNSWTKKKWAHPQSIPPLLRGAPSIGDK